MCTTVQYISNRQGLTAEVGTSDKIPIFRYSDSCRTKKTLSDSYRTDWNVSDQKWGILTLPLCLSSQISPFWWLFREFPQNWHLYSAVGAPADARTVASSSTIFDIPAVAGLPSAVGICDLPIVSTVSYVLVVRSCCCCWCPCWILLSSLLYCYQLSYILSDSGSPTSVIHDVPIVPVTSAVYTVLFQL